MKHTEAMNVRKGGQDALEDRLDPLFGRKPHIEHLAKQISLRSQLGTHCKPESGALPGAEDAREFNNVRMALTLDEQQDLALDGLQLHCRIHFFDRHELTSPMGHAIDRGVGTLPNGWSSIWRLVHLMKIIPQAASHTRGVQDIRFGVDICRKEEPARTRICGLPRNMIGRISASYLRHHRNEKHVP
jgi:hypothetical protein